MTVDTDAARRAALWEKFGRPESFDAAEALRLIGKRGEVHPRDAWACVYQSQEAADAFAESNEKHHGHPHLGHVTLDSGSVLGVIDLRPASLRHGGEITDPALPDGWQPST